MKLKQLSEALGLSQTTVSRALNGYPEVSAATRDRVIEAARRHCYRPDTRAKGLATGRAMAIGHVFPMATKQEIVNPVFSDFIAGAGEAYSSAGYDMVLSVVTDEGEELAYRELKAKGNVDGIIIHAPRMNDPRVSLLHDLNLPFVVHGRATGTETPYNWVDVNNRRAFQQATDHLLDLGHRRIALLNGAEFMDFAIRRRAGYEAALAARGLLIDPDLMRAGQMTEGYGYGAALQMLSAGNRAPTAFLTSSLTIAIGVRRALWDLGLTPGRDVSLVTYDDELSYLRNGEEKPIFTATRSSVRMAGRRAAELLLQIIDSGDPTPRNELLEAEFVTGPSSGPAPR
ncbi:MAG: substrate-binding domain-containing protein [Paracoccaceae bacterium]